MVATLFPVVSWAHLIKYEVDFCLEKYYFESVYVFRGGFLWKEGMDAGWLVGWMAELTALEAT